MNIKTNHFTKKPFNLTEQENKLINFVVNKSIIEFYQYRAQNKWPETDYLSIFSRKIRTILVKYFANDQNVVVNQKILNNVIKQEIIIFLSNNYLDFIRSILNENQYKNFVDKCIGNNKYDFTTKEASFVLYIFYCVLTKTGIYQIEQITQDSFSNDVEKKIFDKYDYEIRRDNQILLNNIEKVINTKLSNISIRSLYPHYSYISCKQDMDKDFCGLLESRYSISFYSNSLKWTPNTFFYHFKNFFFECFDKNSKLNSKNQNIYQFSSFVYNPLNFLQSIYKHNSEKVYLKLFDYIFKTKLSQKKFYSIVTSNKMDIEYCFEDYFKALNSYHTGWILNKRLSVNMAYSFYPLYKIGLNTIEQGHKLFDDFIKKAYGSNSDKIKKFISNLNSRIEIWDVYGKSSVGTVKDLLMMYDIKYTDIQNFLKKACNSWFDDQSIIDRFYLVFALVKNYADDYDEVINSVMSGFVATIFANTGIDKIKIKSELRDKNYLKLKNILKKINITLDDSLSEEYKICLLDKSVATISEKEKFPEFEMLGDKIWNQSIAEMLYNDAKNSNSSKIDNGCFKKPLSDGNPDHLVRTYMKASTQEIAAKMFGIDSLYITASKNKTKYEKINLYNDYVSDRENNYIADSLEMLLGVYSKQTSVKQAIKFCKKIISYSFGKSLYYRELSEEMADAMLDIDTYEENCKNCLIDLMSICSVGIETKEKRKKLSFKSFISNIDLKDKLWESYLKDGFDNCLESFKDKLVNIQ